MRPFRQGQLDGLCGAYRVINAMRLLVGPRRLTAAAGNILLSEMLGHISDKGYPAHEAIYSGLSGLRLLQAVQFARDRVFDQYGVTIRKSCPWYGKPPPEADAFFRQQDRALHSGGPGQHVAILATAEHYTVLTGLAGSRLKLADSAGWDHWSMRHCHTGTEPDRRFTHALSPHFTVILSR